MKPARMTPSGLAAVCFLAALGGGAEDAGGPLELDLRLEKAAFWGGTTETTAPPNACTLYLLLKRAGETWERVVGYAGGGPKTCHNARVTAGNFTGQELEVSLDVQLNSDAWQRGGRAAYKVNLKRQADGRFAGNYTGTCRGIEMKGNAEALIWPPRKPAPGFVPVQPGEHPRILFRKHDLAALKAKARTPFGQALLAKLEGPVGLGLKYQLTGDEKLAQQAMEPIWKMMTATIYHSNFGGSGPLAEQTAITYDLCHPAWPETFRRRVEDYLARYIHCAFHSHGQFLTSRINWHACSNYAGPINTGAGFGGLAIWGRKGPEPAKPAAPCAVVEIPAAADYRPGREAPVVALEPGKTPGRWIYSEPAPVRLWREDPLADLGGLEKCRPEAGAKYTVGIKESVFGPLEAKFILPDGNVDMAKLLGSAAHQEMTLCFYTVLDNPEPRLLKAHCPNVNLCTPQLVLHGRPVGDGQLVRLEKGLYPFLVVFRGSAKGGQTGWPPLDARLDAATDEDLQKAKESLPALEAEYREQLKDWAYDVAEWKRWGGADPECLKLFQESWLGLYLHYREGMGTGGFQAEVGHYSSNASTPPTRYAAAYRSMFGVNASPHDDVTHYLTRKVFAHLYLPGGKTLAQDINGTPGVGESVFGALFPVTPEEWKPALLWAWNNLGEKAAVGSGDPLRAFLYYPLEMQPQPPQGILPLTWQAPDFGFYGFRNSWEGKDDFIAQVFLKARPIFGWNGPNGGTFRLLGLGHTWAHGTEARERCRWLENVVMLPEDKINEGGCARLTYSRFEKDGSGVLAFDMSEIYADESTKGLYESYGVKRRPEALKESGIKGLRSIAVDYSGKSGAPCLFAVADKISGGKSKVWLWQLDSPDGGKGAKGNAGANLKDTKTDGRCFTIAKAGGVTLRGTFAAPAPVQLKAEARKVNFYNSHSGNMSVTLPAVFAGGADPNASAFFVVVTIQRGAPPEVSVQGAGLDAKVTIGRRSLAFDGEKLVLGDKE